MHLFIRLLSPQSNTTRQVAKKTPTGIVPVPGSSESCSVYYGYVLRQIEEIPRTGISSNSTRSSNEI